MNKYKHIKNHNKISQELATIVKHVHNTEDPFVITEYKKLFTSSVGMFSRANVAAYFMKKYFESQNQNTRQNFGRNKQPYSQRDRDPRESRESRDREPRGESRERAPRESREREPRESRDRAPRESRDRAPRESRDREPRESRDHAPRESREREPREREQNGESSSQPRYETYDLNVTKLDASYTEFRKFLTTLPNIANENIAHIRLGEKNSTIRVDADASKLFATVINGAKFKSVTLQATPVTYKSNDRRD